MMADLSETPSSPGPDAALARYGATFDLITWTVNGCGEFGG